MENTIFSGRPDVSAAYDYRVYDRVWQRVTPGVDPYSADPAEAVSAAAPGATSQEAPAPAAAAPAVSTRQEETPPNQEGVGTLPGAEQNPCCMGTVAQESLAVLEGFIEEELAGRRCCLSLACKVCNQSAARLLRRIAAEKQCAARSLCAARFLITGTQQTPAITVEHRCWENLAQALRSCYHQEACGGFNYQRAADGTTDPCLQKLFTRLSQEAYCRAEAVMSVLGTMVC